MKKVALVFSFLACSLVHAEPDVNGFSKGLLKSIIVRFYYVQRLSKGVKRLVWMSKRKLVPLHLSCEVNVHKNVKTLVINNEITFTHPRIVWCLEHIEKYHSLKPFIEIWDDLYHFQLVNDEHVLREFTYLLFYLYKDVVGQEIFTRYYGEKELFSSIVNELSSLESSDLEDILDVIDHLVDELPAFIEKYELSSDMSWKKWLRKHWFLAPVSFAVLLLRAYVSYTAKQAARNAIIDLGVRV